MQEDELQPNEEIHILSAGGFVPGLPGIHGPGTRIVVDRETQEPRRILPHASPEPEPEPVEEAQPEQEAQAQQEEEHLSLKETLGIQEAPQVVEAVEENNQ